MLDKLPNEIIVYIISKINDFQTFKNLFMVNKKINSIMKYHIKLFEFNYYNKLIKNYYDVISHFNHYKHIYFEHRQSIIHISKITKNMKYIKDMKEMKTVEKRIKN